MAKSDSFFIRATVNTTGSFAQTPIDLGAYVDALGKSVLRIHNVAVQTYQSAPGADWSIPHNTNANLSYQLTTQSQTAVLNATDKSVIASGALHIANALPLVANGYSFLSDSPDVMPQDWTSGYLVAVEQIYLGAACDAQLSVGNVTVVLECTVETMTQAAAMALALSQQ